MPFGRMINLKTKKPIFENSPRSARLDAFEQAVSRGGYQTRTIIDQMTRFKGIDGKERFKYQERRQAFDAKGNCILECIVRRNFPVDKRARDGGTEYAREREQAEKDLASDKFDYNPRNLKGLEKLCHHGSTYSIELDPLGNNSSGISHDAFFSMKWDDLYSTKTTSATRDLANTLKDLIQNSGGLTARS